MFKNFPLPFHPNARPAAYAAEAARQQGKFWEMNEKIFANQAQLGSQPYEGWAKELGLNVDKFKKAVDDPKTRARVDEDFALAQQIAVPGTPTFFVDGVQVENGSFDGIKAMVDADLKKVERPQAKR